jgi:hypothetical protein
MNKYIVLMLLLLAENSIAGFRMDDGSRVGAGDNISLLYAQWGREVMRVSSKRTCNRIIKLKRDYCSTRRLIWQRDGRYMMVQISGQMIIKTGWTRSQRELKTVF